MVFEALSQNKGERNIVLDFGAAVEIAHSISLMVDDLIDGDQTRRGEAAYHITKGTRGTVLEAMRLLSVPYSIVGPYGTAATDLLCDAHDRMVRGAISELDLERLIEGKAGYQHLISMKSGRLFELAAEYGALSAGCCEEKIMLAGKYGNCLGKALQLADDIADLKIALAGGRSIEVGSEACLFRSVVEGEEDRQRAVERRALHSSAEAHMERELSTQVRSAQKAARRLTEAVGRCGGRKGIHSTLLIMLSAPREVAELMLASGRDGMSPMQ
jgi:geranylgeranyl pyrophosphate synthase